MSKRTNYTFEAMQSELSALRTLVAEVEGALGQNCNCGDKACREGNTARALIAQYRKEHTS